MQIVTKKRHKNVCMSLACSIYDLDFAAYFNFNSVSIYFKSDVVWCVILLAARNQHHTPKRYSLFLTYETLLLSVVVSEPIFFVALSCICFFFFFSCWFFFALLPDYIWKLELICWYIEWVFDVSNGETRNDHKSNQKKRNRTTKTTSYTILFFWFVSIWLKHAQNCKQRQTLHWKHFYELVCCFVFRYIDILSL